MTWFVSWWDSLSLIGQIFACAAIPGTVLLVLQTVLLLFGLGGHDADHGEIDSGHDLPADHDTGGADADLDMDADVDTDGGAALDHDHDGAHHAAGIRLFTVRGLVAFFAVGGWLGVALSESGVGAGIAAVLALIGGFLALLAVALILKWALGLQESGNLDLRRAIAHTAVVYLTIPAARTGSGKVNLTLQEQYVELEAVTDCDHPLQVGSQVQVSGVTAGNTLVVRPVVSVLNGNHV